MKKILLITMTLLTVICYSQQVKELDKSPLDFAIFRPNGQDTEPIVRIIYSRPQKRNREIFGKLVPYNKVWRTGANQSTEVNLYSDVYFENNLLKAGSYTLYTIPGEKEWVIIFNSKLYTWGAYDYDESKNVLKIKVPVIKSINKYEALSMAFEGSNGNGKLLIAWDTVEVVINIKYEK